MPHSLNKFTCGKAIGVDTDGQKLRVRTEKGVLKEFPYDYLLIGTGSSYAGTIKPNPKEFTYSQRQATWTTEFERLRRAQSVLIIGGGPVGVELAGEILTKYPTKHVTITDRQSELCSEFHPRTKKHIKVTVPYHP